MVVPSNLAHSPPTSDGKSVRILDVRETTMAMRSPGRNAFIDFSKMTTSVVAVTTNVVRDGHQVTGFGFNSNGRYAAGGILRDRVIPRIREADPASLLSDAGTNLDPHRIWATMMQDEKPGGHGERSVAVGTVDMAVWDAVAKIQEQPLYEILAERYGTGKPDPMVWVYAAGGYYHEGKGLERLREEMQSYLNLGYRVVKIKIGGAPLDEDLRRIEAVLDLLAGDSNRLCVDANGRFDLETATRYAEALAPYRVRWFEEPLDPLDFAAQAALGERYGPAMATGENLFSHQDARNLLRHGGLRPDRDVLQFDPVLSYGLVEYLRTLEMVRERGWSWKRLVPHGGHQFALNIAAGLGLGGNESYPGIFQPFGGFADAVPIVDGFVHLPVTPGIGFEHKPALMAVFNQLAA